MNRVDVVGAAIIKDDKVLAAQRSPKMKSAYKWEFAGGKVEPGESHQEALVRELREELGITAEISDYIATGFTVSEGREIALHVYETRIVAGIPEAKEHMRLMWIKIPEIETLDWAEADLPACDELIRRYRKIQ
jgi:8-oxo-dGTP diphosphatase